MSNETRVEPWVQVHFLGIHRLKIVNKLENLVFACVCIGLVTGHGDSIRWVVRTGDRDLNAVTLRHFPDGSTAGSNQALVVFERDFELDRERAEFSVVRLFIEFDHLFSNVLQRRFNVFDRANYGDLFRILGRRRDVDADGERAHHLADGFALAPDQRAVVIDGNVDLRNLKLSEADLPFWKLESRR